MIRVLVMSDSHGDELAIRKALSLEPEATVVIHLGDGAEEAKRVAREHPERTWYCVRGNCDYTQSLPLKQMVSVGGKRLYLTHGAYERVKSSLLTLSLSARNDEADAALFGHTHRPQTEYDAGMLLLNPGSLSGTRTYALLEIEDGMRSKILRLDRNT